MFSISLKPKLRVTLYRKPALGTVIRGLNARQKKQTEMKYVVPSTALGEEKSSFSLAKLSQKLSV